MTRRGACVLLVLGLLLARPAQAATPESRPAWVGMDAVACKSGAANVALASGSAEGIRSSNLAISTAQNRARAGLVRLLAGETVKTVEKDGVRATQRTSSGTLDGAQIVDGWLDPSTCSQYALARVPLPPDFSPAPERSCEQVLDEAGKKPQPPAAAPKKELSLGLSYTPDPKDMNIFRAPAGELFELDALASAWGVGFDKVLVRAELSGAPKGVRMVPAALLLGPVPACGSATGTLALDLREVEAGEFQLKIDAQEQPSGVRSNVWNLKVVLGPPPPPELRFGSLLVSEQEANDGRLAPGETLIVDLSFTIYANAKVPEVSVKLEGKASEQVEILGAAPRFKTLASGSDTKAQLWLALSSNYKGPPMVDLSVVIDAGKRGVIGRRELQLGVGLPLSSSRSPDPIGVVLPTELLPSPAALGLSDDDASAAMGWIGQAINRRAPDMRRQAGCSTLACQKKSIRPGRVELSVASRIERSKETCQISVSVVDAKRRQRSLKKTAPCQGSALFVALGALADEALHPPTKR